jgi:hypothetical protein
MHSIDEEAQELAQEHEYALDEWVIEKYRWVPRILCPGCQILYLQYYCIESSTDQHCHHGQVKRGV